MEFRLWLAEGLVKKSNLDRRFILTIEDVGYERADIAPLLSAWDELYEVRKEGSFAQAFEEVGSLIHDCLLETWDEFINPWNHESGFQVEKRDMGEISQEIEKALKYLEGELI